MNRQYDHLVDEHTLRTTIIENIKTVMRITGLNRAQFAAKTGIAAPTLTSYLSDKETKITPVTFLMNVCMMEEVKALGLKLTVNDLISSEFDPIVSETGKPLQKPDHDDFLGCYYCYYFDQSKPLSEREFTTSRDLRFGVMTIFDEYNKLTGEVSYEAYVVFFKAIDRGQAVILKENIEAIFRNDRYELSERNSVLRALLRRESGLYTGSVRFSEAHAFISITSNVFHDRAMMAFYAPSKRADHSYIGGIGVVSSVSHGSEHMPVAQKILISAPKLGCADEVIAEHLSMMNAPIDLGRQGQALSELCTKLFDVNTRNGFLDDGDKKAIVTARMNQLVADYIHKIFFSVGSVSREEDNRVYNLIKRYQ